MSAGPQQGPPARTVVRFRDRQTRAVCLEAVPAEGPLRWLYETWAGRAAGWPLFGWRLASALGGCWQRSACSRRQIAPFVAHHGIDPGEAELPVAAYPSFNAFFTRRLRPGARPFAVARGVLCAPADGKVLVFPTLGAGDDFPVKGARLTPPALLAGAAGADRFVAGSGLVVRLAPPDYHRFHFCDSGTADRAVQVRGQLHSVNPIALARRPRLFAANRRAVTSLWTDGFGLVMQIEVGAFAVGSIVQTYAPGPVWRGQEKGFFQFGGSSLVLLFEAGAVAFDEDLVRDSAAGLEVRVRAGERLGHGGAG
jgi:phosphatidylserine decarboxylase